MSKIFKSEYLNKIFSKEVWEEEKQISKVILKTQYYKVDRAQQYSVEELIEIMKRSNNFEMFIEMMNEIRAELLYKSNVHGQNHIERTSLLAFAIGEMERLDPSMIELCVMAAKYHDIGRNEDNEDPLHGIIGAKKLNDTNILEKYCADDQKIILNAIRLHSLDDSFFERITYRLSDIEGEELLERSKTVVNVLKDADALDRFRLSPHSLRIEFMRTESSLRLVRSACEMVYMCE